MHKFLISLCLVASFGLAQAQTTPIAKPAPKDDGFAQKKTLALQALAGREQIMSQEKVCATNSQNIDQLKACFNQANSNRKAMVEELKAKREQLRK